MKAHPELARRAGTWSVVMTLRPTRDAKPVVVSGLIAERTTLGSYLQETMKPAPGAKVADFRRVDFTTYNDLQGRWQYVVMDTRAPVGLMFAQGMDGDEGQGMTVYFADFPAPTGLVPNMDGRYMRARHVLTRESDDREVVRQYWRLGSQPEWLGIQYEYTRTRTP